MRETLIERITKTEEGKRLYEQERAILDVTELICELMEQEGVSRSKLARRLGKSKSYVTRLLAGNANMTVRTLSDVFVALGSTIRFQHGQAFQSAHGSKTMTLFENPAIWEKITQWPSPVAACGPSEELADRLAC